MNFWVSAADAETSLVVRFAASLKSRRMLRFSGVISLLSGRESIDDEVLSTVCLKGGGKKSLSKMKIATNTNPCCDEFLKNLRLVYDKVGRFDK